MLSIISPFYGFAVFDSSTLTLWINCFITNFSIFHSTFSRNVKRVNDDFHFQNDGLLYFHALLFGPFFLRTADSDRRVVRSP